MNPLDTRYIQILFVEMYMYTYRWYHIQYICISTTGPYLLLPHTSHWFLLLRSDAAMPQLASSDFPCMCGIPVPVQWFWWLQCTKELAIMVFRSWWYIEHRLRSYLRNLYHPCKMFWIVWEIFEAQLTLAFGTGGLSNRWWFARVLWENRAGKWWSCWIGPATQVRLSSVSFNKKQWY